MCGGKIVDYFPVNAGIRHSVLAPTLFSTCIDHVRGRMQVSPSCGVSFGSIGFTDLDFANDAVIFAATTGAPSEAL